MRKRVLARELAVERRINAWLSRRYVQDGARIAELEEVIRKQRPDRLDTAHSTGLENGGA